MQVDVQYVRWKGEIWAYFQSAASTLSRIIIADQPPLHGWRFFGKRLWVHNLQDQAVIGSHERLRDAVIDVCDRIQQAGFGMVRTSCLDIGTSSAKTYSRSVWYDLLVSALDLLHGWSIEVNRPQGQLAFVLVGQPRVELLPQGDEAVEVD